MSTETHISLQGAGALVPEHRARLLAARALMIEALDLLDDHSRSFAPAWLDLAIHQLGNELNDPSGVD